MTKTRARRRAAAKSQFDASFEGGNLGVVKQITENEYELTIRPDTNAARYRLWFHFRVANARPGQKVLFHVTNFSKSKSLYKDGMSPVFRAGNKKTGSGGSRDRAWERVHPKNVFYYRTKDSLSAAPGRGGGGRGASGSIERCGSGGSAGSAGNDDESEKGTLSDGNESASERRRPRKPHILSFTHVFGKDERAVPTKKNAADADADGDAARNSFTKNEDEDEDAEDASSSYVEFAYSYPFTFAEVNKDLTALEDKNLPHVHRRVLTHSLQGRGCDVVVIDGGNDPDAPPGTALAPRRVVFLTCRVHPGETPASHALGGFLDFVTSDAPDAVSLRRKVTFVVVPMLNPDGCVAGNYRADSNGADLNRRWADCVAHREPTLHATKALVKWYARDPCHALDFFIDLHAHTSSKASFLYVEPPRFFFGLDADDGDGGERDSVTKDDDETAARDDLFTKASRGETFREKCEKAFAWERAAVLPRMLELNAGPALGFALSHCRFCENPEKAGAGRRAVGAMLAREARDAAARARAAQTEEERERFAPVSLGLLRGAGAGMCYTLEMSFYGVCPPRGFAGARGERSGWSPFTSNDETYRRFGVGLAYSFLDYYGLRRDADAEAVTSRVFDAAATGECTHPERAFGVPVAEQKPELFAACVTPHAPSERRESKSEERAEPWLRGAEKDALSKNEKEKSRFSRASKSERAAKRAAAAAAAALAKEKARPERPRSSSRRESDRRVLASNVAVVVGSDLDTTLGDADGGTNRSSSSLSSSGKMVGGVAPPSLVRAKRKKRGAFESSSSNAFESSAVSAVVSRASSNEKEKAAGSTDRPLAGGQFRNTSELRRAGTARRRTPQSAAAKTSTLLGSFRVPGLGAFGKGSASSSAGIAGDAFGVEAEFARAKLSE